MNSELLKQNLINRALDLGLFVGQSAARLINDEWAIVERDYHSSLAMVQDTGETEPEEYLSSILDGHMDTIIKTIINIIVSSITEKALDENETPVDMPDIVEYIKAHRAEYDLEGYEETNTRTAGEGIQESTSASL